MNAEIAKLRGKARETQSECDKAKGNLLEAVRNCRHRWGPTQDAHIYTEGFTIPGDPPGVGGSDHRCDCYVDAKTDKRWKRVCMDCGKEQFTTNVRKEVIEHPQF
jgi:hypothetical protein